MLQPREPLSEAEINTIADRNGSENTKNEGRDRRRPRLWAPTCIGGVHAFGISPDRPECCERAASRMVGGYTMLFPKEVP